MIAALFVQKNGVYQGRSNVDPWDMDRDARKYGGPWPVVAHPPCARWGNYWFGSPSSAFRYERGEDAGCFASAFQAVTTYGGVIEHPKGSAAWDRFGIAHPPTKGGWVSAGSRIPGWTCCVEQGHYGHRARKATWLYVVGREPYPLRWGPSKPINPRVVEHMSHLQRAATPLEFQNLLISIAHGCARIRQQA